MALKVLVCGSRDWDDAAAITNRLGLIPFVRPDVPVVIHGAAPGADTLAAKAARGFGMRVQAFPADWKTHGKAAGPIRNLQMLDQEPHVVLAFQRNGSRGTQHTIDEARKRGIKVEVFDA